MKHYDFDVSIIYELMTNNLEEMIKYLSDKKITYELKKQGEKLNGKYKFTYNHKVFYFDYIIHLMFFRLSCPHGFEKDDVDLPEKFFFAKKIVYDTASEKYLIAKEYNCYFELTDLNNYGNYLIDDNGIMGVVELSRDEDDVYSVTDMGPMLDAKIKQVLIY